MSESRLGRASAWLLAATAVANLSMLAYHRIVSQRLGAAYAQLVALMAVVNVLGNVTLGLNTYLVKAFSADAERRGPAAVKGRLLRLAGPGLLSLGILAAGMALLSPWLAEYLKLPDSRTALMVAVIFSAGVVLLVFRSAQQGLHHFGWLGLSLAAEGLVRVGSAFTPMAAGVVGALVAVALGQGAGALCAWAGVTGLGPAIEASDGGSLVWALSEGGADTLALTLLAALCYLDVVVLKHYYSDERAGLYSRAALVAKSFLYLPAALNMVLLAAAARAIAGGRDPRPLLKRFLSGALALELMGLAFVWVRTAFCLRLLAGSDPRFSSPVMVDLTRWFSLAVVPLGLLQMVVAYLLAVRRPGVAVGLALLTAVYLALLSWVWNSELAVVASLGACASAGLGVALAAALTWSGKAGRGTVAA